MFVYVALEVILEQRELQNAFELFVEASVVTEGFQQEKLLGESSAPMKTARGRTLKTHREVSLDFLLFFVR